MAIIMVFPLDQVVDQGLQVAGSQLLMRRDSRSWLEGISFACVKHVRRYMMDAYMDARWLIRHLLDLRAWSRLMALVVSWRHT